MSETSSKDVLLVTGAAGQLGRRVLAHLLDTHAVKPSRLIAVTRDPAKLGDLKARGVDVRRGDFDDRSSLPSALQGADRMLLISTDALDRPGARITQHRTAISAAMATGVKHVVYTSMPKPDVSVIPFASDHLGTEQALAESGLGWTVLRNAWYFENLGLALPHALASGQWATAAGEGRTAYVSREDCARAAAAALVSADSSNRVYDVTGAKALSIPEIAAVVAGALERPIVVAQVSDEQLVQGYVGAGLPEPLARIFASFDTNARLGHFDLVSDAVETLTGRPPETLADFVAANGRTFLPAAA